ncbi:hypothetical protein [Burkholderia gladioli]|nr:hypothetical protein [Burkholderia gladioli]
MNPPLQYDNIAKKIINQTSPLPTASLYRAAMSLAKLTEIL